MLVRLSPSWLFASDAVQATQASWYVILMKVVIVIVQVDLFAAKSKSHRSRLFIQGEQIDINVQLK